MRVQRVGFAAIKGTRHLTRSSVHLTADGAEGDRRFAIVDPATHHVLRTVAHPSLARVEARVDADLLTLQFPDGTAFSGSTDRTGAPVTGDYWGRPVLLHPLDGALAACLSSALGRPATLCASDPGQVVWGAPVSVVTTGALHQLEHALRAAGQDVPTDLAERFRATMTLEAASDPMPGSRLQVGAAVIEIVGAIDRCAVVDADPRTGLRAGGLLAALARPDGPPLFGLGARVVEPGTVVPGDRVVVMP
ncbi:MOSC N-terminal beta barrel domain-containing protein [Phycicoccus sp. Root101]|uniref:MOSC domain-containing protein n=1 Tax=Phycicoccus sp. Root101 TaxID=1736421 RepID=UPI0007033638|nr:MOSC N-terminal beta barrel domain-containing protein [Phycicoccus sp. Root101]KQU65179.1 hypothetical protein ASC58_16810 [Phycicoccus sp. Root101]